MWDVSDRFKEAIRSSHARLNEVTHLDLITTISTILQPTDGSITDDSTSNVRRTLTLTMANEQATWDALDTVGGEITVRQAIRYVDGTREWAPMGVFIVDTDEIGYGPDGDLQITGAPDRWGKVQKNKLPPSQRSSVASNAAWQEIKRLVEGAWNDTYPFPGWASVDETATTKAGALVWDDGDREAAILDLCKANSVEVFFDREGKGVLQPVPVLTDTSTPVWTIDAGAPGVVMLDADRTRDRSKVANVIIVSTSATDIVFNPVEVKNTTASDPLAVDGPLGYMPEELTLPTLRNSTQATAAGKTELAKRLGVAKQLTLSSSPNFALDSEDVNAVVLPQIARGVPRATELHILDTITHPLAPSGTQDITTRSTRPDTDGT